jgi:hypothetical protein
MSREEQIRRIPTSDELERQGALIPATGGQRSERRGGLLRFFRASRFRVSDDVAARKHVGSQEVRTPPVATSSTGPTVGTSSQPETPAHSGRAQISAIPEARRSPEGIVPRTIRLDPAVKERRGFGPSDRKGRSGQ